MLFKFGFSKRYFHSGMMATFINEKGYTKFMGT
jgi:hypothetical protein